MSTQERRGSIMVIAVACLIFGMAWLTIGLPFFLRQTNVQRHWARANARLLSASVIEDVTPGGKLYRRTLNLNWKRPPVHASLLLMLIASAQIVTRWKRRSRTGCPESFTLFDPIRIIRQKSVSTSTAPSAISFFRLFSEVSLQSSLPYPRRSSSSRVVSSRLFR